MKLAIALFCSSLLATSSAFAPQSTQHRPKSSLSAFSVAYDEGAQAKANARLSGRTLPGDFGFDPIGFSKKDYGTTGKSTNGGLFFQREAEIKHARIAMLAAAGWPIAELFDKPLAKIIGAAPLVDSLDRTPSILNGGLDQISPVFWVSILALASAVDLYQINKANNDPDYTSGDLGFDPLGLYPKDEAGQLEMQRKEINNGRLAMLAITAFAFQEAVTGLGVVSETPMFFKPFLFH